MCQPGAYSGVKLSAPVDCAKVIDAVKRDGVTEPNSTGECPCGRHKVYLVIDIDGRDYHWYRQDSDGTWSHKRGPTEVTNLDAPVTRNAKGKPITDPSKCNRTYPEDNLNYSKDCGTLCAKN